MKYEEGDIVVIRWLDTIDENKWSLLETAKKDDPMEMKTIGWLVVDDEKKITVAGSVAADQSVSYVSFPKGCILGIEKIAEGELDDFKEET